MRAMVVDGSFGVDSLCEVERPSAPCGPGQVRVALRAASLNYRDLLMVKGQYNPRQPLPLVPCSDGAGEVTEVGGDVTSLSVGDRVATCFTQGWLAGPHRAAHFSRTLGGPLDGTLQQELVLDSDGVIAFPRHLSFEEAATLPCAALTAWSALVPLGRLESGQTVLVLGTGGVSLFALQFARALGAEVIVTSSSATKRARAEEMGAKATLDYTAEPRWGRAAKKLNGGEGVDLVVEVGGAGTLAQSLRAVRESGTVALIGVLAGGAEKVDLTPVLMRQIAVQGVFTGHKASFKAMNKVIGHTGMRPVVDRVFDLEHTAEAFRYLESGAHFGKVVISLPT